MRRVLTQARHRSRAQTRETSVCSADVSAQAHFLNEVAALLARIGELIEMKEARKET
jgi:hypothetical protein